MPAAAIPIVIAAASIGGAAYASHEAGQAADRQAEGATRAATQDREASRSILQALGPRLNQPSNGYSPYQEMGQSALSSLSGRYNLPAPTLGNTRTPIDLAPLLSGLTVHKRTDAPEMGMAARPTAPQTMTPALGQTKTFPNGKVGRWDGRGWELVQ